MSNLYIEEYATLAVIDGTQVPVGQQPAIATQVVSFTGTAGTSAAFNAQTRFVRITADGIFSYLFGTAPTATTSHPRVAAGVAEYFGVPPTGTYKVSAVTNT